ncbi:hypothetical protein RFF84_09420, partial [Streptococcus ruminantium]
KGIKFYEFSRQGRAWDNSPISYIKSEQNQFSDNQNLGLFAFFCSIIDLKDLIIEIFKIENLFVPSSFYIELTDLSHANLVSKNGLAARLSNNHLLIHQKYKQ